MKKWLYSEICKWTTCLLFNYDNRKKNNTHTLSWSASSTWLFVLSNFLCVLNTAFKNEKWDIGVSNCFPFQTFYQVYHALMLKINKSSPFVSFTCLWFLFYVQTVLNENFYCAFPETGERMSSCTAFLQFFFSLNIIGSLCSFSTRVFDGRKVCYRIGTEFCETGRTLGGCVFFKRKKERIHYRSPPKCIS